MSKLALLWSGPPPTATLRAALLERGVTLVRRGPALRVQATAGAEPPAPPPGDGPWIWATTAEPTLAAASAAVCAGAADVVALAAADAAARLAARASELAAPEPPLPDLPGMVTRSRQSRETLRQALKVAKTAMPVLLTGETGTGKEETARLIHDASGRRGPWVPINCAAIPNELMESELFGHAKGAFSGAVTSFDGKLMAARGGTVFLDEIDDTPLSTQVKLLRVLEDGEVTRLGETRPQQVDFRILAATNRDLGPLIARGQFGQDLYERLAIVRLELAPLRERREDIPELAEHFLRRYAERQGVAPQVTAIDPLVMAALLAHPWPGNIRELRNVLYQAMVQKERGEVLLLSDLRRLLQPAAKTAAAEAGSLLDREALVAQVCAGDFDLRREVAALERAALDAALAAAGGNAARAARLLGTVGRGTARDPGSTLRAMMRRLGVG
ncbi:MAG TPA: sigma-54 dependent transcriptional regulator [Thermoanaerobaculia bacterium]|nr:sigma-54 dependent transcriptional regulator [Thermoanaerobaculia bacterium]